MTNVKRSRKNDISTVLMAIALICLMAGGYVISRKKVRMKEAVALPFYKIEMSEVAELTNAIKTYVNECLTRFIVGDLDIDDDGAWEAYKNELNAMQLDRWIELAQTSYDRTR